MMTRDADKKREQMLMFCMDDMVPRDHLLRKIDRAINWNFIYDLVEDKYCADNGRPSLDPVLLIKIVFIQYLYGIRSMRQTIKEIEVNVAYRWFLGLDMLDEVPHFSTFGKNYTRRFKDTDLFEQIFSHILDECMKYHLVDTSVIFADAFYNKKNLDPQLHEASDTNTVQVPEGVDAELLSKVLSNPEMAALLSSLAKSMQK